MINARERPYSPDIADMQSLIGRTLSHLLRQEHATVLSPSSTPAPEQACYGLAISATVGLTYVTVSPGVLMQLSSTLVPVPGSLDSPYRVGLLHNITNVTIPATGSPVWMLLEARVSESSVSEQRDQLNATTGAFESQLVPKRKEYGIEFAWNPTTSATQIPAPRFGDWVPIGSILVQTSSSIALAADVVDVRPSVKARSAGARQDWSRSAEVTALRTVATPTAEHSYFIRLAVARAITNQPTGASYGGGLELGTSDDDATLNSFDPTTVAIRDANLASIAADTWYYLYMVPWFDSAPVHARSGVPSARGILVLSGVAPDSEGLFNSAAIIPPAPFGSYTVPAGQAPCVGALRANGAPAWDPMAGGNGNFAMSNNNNYNTCGFSAASDTTNIPAAVIPAHAKTITWSVIVTATGAADTILMEIGQAAFVANEGFNSYVWPLSATAPITMFGLITVPKAHSAKSLITHVRTINAQTGIIVGYTT